MALLKQGSPVCLINFKKLLKESKSNRKRSSGASSGNVNHVPPLYVTSGAKICNKTKRKI
jgi:hypothetical protein